MSRDGDGPVVRSLSPSTQFLEYPSTFPVSRRPVIFWDARPRIMVDFRMSSSDERFWMARVDAIIGSRVEGLERCGLVQTGSYKRAQFILRNSRFRSRMLWNGDSDEKSGTIRAFKLRAGEGAVLVSPSMVAGVNFPDDECRWILWPKLPYPDMRSPVMRRRQKEDRDQRSALMVKQFVQGCGRGNRHEMDWCEAITVDGHASHIRADLDRFAPGYFNEAWQVTTTMPPPLQP